VKSQSNVPPKRIVISSLKKGKRTVCLRHNSKERVADSMKLESEKATKDVLYEYEEVCIEMQDRADLYTFVDANFDKLFEEALESEYKEKKNKIRQYLKIGWLNEKDIDFYVASGILKEKREVL